MGAMARAHAGSARLSVSSRLRTAAIFTFRLRPSPHSL